MRTLFSFTVLLLFPLTLWAGVGFVHESGFSVTPFSPTVTTTSLVRLDQSGSLGLLWKQGPTVRLYDAAGDSILFSHTSDTSEFLCAALLEDINGDKLADLVLTSMIFPYTNPLSEWRITCFDCASGFTDSISESYFSDTQYSAVVETGIYSYLFWTDVDQDEEKELIFSYSETSEGFMTVYEGGYTVCYDRFPDTVAWNRSYLSTAAISLEDANGYRIDLFRTYDMTYYDFMGRAQYINASLNFLQSDGHVTAVSPPCQESTYCIGDGGSNHCGYSSMAVGDIAGTFSGQELLATQNHGFYCYYEPTTSSSAELMLFSLDANTPANGLNLIWSVPYTSLPTSLGNFIVHPDLPGYFFGIAGDTLIMFNGENGSIRTTTTDLPSGQRYWNSNWPDSLPRLVVMNGHQVDIYSMDITTDADDDTPSTLPGEFLLGRPYPNPFNAETTIPINLPKRGNLKVEIYNLLGQTVATLVDRELPAGESRLTWDASDRPSGVYLVRAVSGDKSESRKLLLLK